MAWVSRRSGLSVGRANHRLPWFSHDEYVRGEVNVEAPVSDKAFADRGCFVNGVVFADQVHV